MKELMPFMMENPIISLFMLWVICATIQTVIFRSWNRLMRHLNIARQGWPPSHCDADGEFKSEADK